MLRPNYLQTGDKVALVSPAGNIAPEYIEHAIQLLSSWGLEPIAGKHVAAKYNYFAGTDAERAEDMQWAMNDEDIRAIFCTRGGYGCMRIVEQLDYSKFQGNPKWLIGCSDITVFHSKLNTLGIESLHGPMPKSFQTTDQEALRRTRKFLSGQITPYIIPAHPFNREGVVQAELVGGNLCLLHCIRSSAIEHYHRNSILFIEDVGENLYAVDRMMQSLKLAGKFEYLQGVIVGSFSEMQGESFGKTAYEIIKEALEDYDFPVCFGFPAGHTSENYPLILGANIEFSVEKNGAEIKFL